MWNPNDPPSSEINSAVGWWVANAHNGFLEIALDLGWLGVLIMVLMIGTAIRRGVHCCITGVEPLGWFALMFFLGTTLSAQTTVNLGHSQVIEWLVFNAFLISCGVYRPRFPSSPEKVKGQPASSPLQRPLLGSSDLRRAP